VEALDETVIKSDWLHDVTGRQYTLTHGGYQAMVLRASTGEWIALLSQNSQAVAHNRCTTLQAAQAWCMAQMDLSAAGQRQ
jgi:hypothetical protein